MCRRATDPDIDTLIENYALLIGYEQRINELRVRATRDELASLSLQAVALTAANDVLIERLRTRGITVPRRI